MHYPDGIGPDNVKASRRHANPLPLAVLAVFLGTGLLGSFGGQSGTYLHAENTEASLSVRAPRILRNGEFFEMVIDVVPKRPAQELVVGISDVLWREMTINTILPAAGKEEFSDGLRRFSFGEIPEGKMLSVKIDGQVNPHLGGKSMGEIAAFDGEKKLAKLTIATKVLP